MGEIPNLPFIAVSLTVTACFSTSVYLGVSGCKYLPVKFASCHVPSEDFMAFGIIFATVLGTRHPKYIPVFTVDICRLTSHPVGDTVTESEEPLQAFVKRRSLSWKHNVGQRLFTLVVRCNLWLSLSSSYIISSQVSYRANFPTSWTVYLICIIWLTVSRTVSANLSPFQPLTNFVEPHLLLKDLWL